MFALGIDFLTRVAVMTDTASRERVEWPPHPARIFMALVAAHYESRPLAGDGDAARAEWDGERKALEWLEIQGAPEMSWPTVAPRDVVSVYVPVNDSSVTGKPANVKLPDLRSALGVMPDRRSRQERTFPAAYIEGHEPACFVVLAWPEAEACPETTESMVRLAGKMASVGHSSSLVRVWVIGPNDLPTLTYAPQSLSSGNRRGMQLRVTAPGFLADLDQRYNADEIDAFFEFSDRIGNSKGAERKKVQEEFAERFGVPWSRSVSAPVRQRPMAGLTANYVPKSQPDSPAASSPFDSELFILAKQEGPTLGLESTIALMTALRGLLLQGAEGLPEWFTGHSAPGVPSTGGHMALIPLAFVGTEHADGHIMGLAIAFPRNVSEPERAACLRERLFGAAGEDIDLDLVMGRQGEWTLRREERASPPRALTSRTWTEPSSVWASVTPVVLDRHPKCDPRNDRVRWREEVAACISESCVRQGLPRPVSIDVDKTSWHRGAPRSRPGSNGMPWLPSKGGSGSRQQVHMLVEFPCEVEGPVLIGAGRFRGYGLCKPLGAPLPGSGQ